MAASAGQRITGSACRPPVSVCCHGRQRQGQGQREGSPRAAPQGIWIQNRKRQSTGQLQHAEERVAAQLRAAVGRRKARLQLSV